MMLSPKTTLFFAAAFTSSVLAQNIPIPGTAGFSSCTTGNGPTGCTLRTSPTTTVSAICVNDPQLPGTGECGYVGAACATDDQCQGSGSCLYPNGQFTGGQCRGYFGDPCGQYLGCLGFLSCGTAADPGTFYPACGGVGALCTTGSECASGTCTNNACTARIAPKVGDPCGIVSQLNNFCGSGMTCNAQSQTCQVALSATQRSTKRQNVARNVASYKWSKQVF